METNGVSHDRKLKDNLFLFISGKDFTVLLFLFFCFSFFSHKNYNFIGTIIILTPLTSIANTMKYSWVFSHWPDIWPAKNIWFMMAFMIHLWDDNQALMIVKKNKLNYVFFPFFFFKLKTQNEIEPLWILWKKVY